MKCSSFKTDHFIIHSLDFRKIDVMSTPHHDEHTGRRTSRGQEPEIETFYNRIQGGVDVDELCSNCDVTQNTKH